MFCALAVQVHNDNYCVIVKGQWLSFTLTTNKSIFFHNMFDSSKLIVGMKVMHGDADCLGMKRVSIKMHQIHILQRFNNFPLVNSLQQAPSVCF